jgi:hypothetical protein
MMCSENVSHIILAPRSKSTVGTRGRGKTKLTVLAPPTRPSFTGKVESKKGKDLRNFAPFFFTGLPLGSPEKKASIVRSAAMIRVAAGTKLIGQLSKTGYCADSWLS